MVNITRWQVGEEEDDRYVDVIDGAVPAVGQRGSIFINEDTRGTFVVHAIRWMIHVEPDKHPFVGYARVIAIVHLTLTTP